MKIRVGLYGTNGHQIQYHLVNHPHAELVATAAFDPAALPPELQADSKIPHYDTLQELLSDEQVEIVSLCSPRRCDQAREAILCLQAGKHAYAEKPCALTEADLDALIGASVLTGYQFHEMAGTAFDQPFLAMREIVAAGTIGTVVQVLAQKSYPYYDKRPQDENLDGGLMCQAGVHALRYIEHVAHQKIVDIQAIETKLGNPHPDGELRMAASYLMRLENSGVASVVANYFNPPGFGSWGNENLRIFGTLGMLEAVNAGKRTRLVVGDEDRGAIDTSTPGKDYFDCFLDSLRGVAPMPFTPEEELHPTRMVIRAKRSAS